jgi:uncharacterized membrane protein (TIGR02234 family)
VNPPAPFVPEPATARTALVTSTVLLIMAAAALGGSALLAWAEVGVPVPLRGTVAVRVSGSALLPALGPLAVLALAAVAAAVALGTWGRWLLGALLALLAVPPVVAVLRVVDTSWLSSVAISAAQLPARASPAGTVTVLPAGPALAAGGAALLAAAGVVLIARGRRMPRLGYRYQTPAARAGKSATGAGNARLWERMDAGEDPTTEGPR